MRRLAATIAALSALACAGTAIGAGGVPPFPRLPGLWSHAEINVTLHRAPHTIILDRGRIVRVSPNAVTLYETVGSTFVTVPLSARTVVVVNGLPATVYDLQRRMMAETMRIDGGAAVRVRANSPRR